MTMVQNAISQRNPLEIAKHFICTHSVTISHPLLMTHGKDTSWVLVSSPCRVLIIITKNQKGYSIVIQIRKGTNQRSALIICMMYFIMTNDNYYYIL